MTSWGCLSWCPGWNGCMDRQSMTSEHHNGSDQQIHFMWPSLLSLLLQSSPVTSAPPFPLEGQPPIFSDHENLWDKRSGRNGYNTDITFLFSQNTQVAIYSQQLLWWERKAVIWMPLYPSCAPHCLYSSNAGCSSVREGCRKVRNSEGSGN